MHKLSIIFSIFFVLFANGSNFTAKKTKIKPVIDGQLEEIWKSGVHINKFKQYNPTLYASASVKTDVYMLYDETNIYIGGIFYQKRNTIKANQYRRDNNEIFSGDWFQINIDPLNSRC